MLPWDSPGHTFIVPEHTHPIEFPRRMKPTAVATAMPHILKNAFNRRGFSDPALLHRWLEVFGKPLGEYTRPLKITFPPGDRRRDGTLHIGVASAFALQAQHALPLFIEKINSMFGYPAITRVKLSHLPLKDFARPAPPKPLPETVPIALPDIGLDKNLKIALARLGGQVKRP
ncbi:MAG: DUF721 domain-containing protein [Holosporales bacterium]